MEQGAEGTHRWDTTGGTVSVRFLFELTTEMRELESHFGTFPTAILIPANYPGE